jgi:hypothetical protein
MPSESGSPVVLLEVLLRVDNALMRERFVDPHEWDMGRFSSVRERRTAYENFHGRFTRILGSIFEMRGPETFVCPCPLKITKLI